MTAFPRAVRLTCGKQFQQVFGNGRRFYSGSFNVRVVANGDSVARLGMAIAKKNLRRAHERNRIRRLIRESFRHHLTQLPPLDIVVMCRSEVLALPNPELFQQLEGLWQRLQRVYSAELMSVSE